jgi:nitrite reductase/ring-hydroxylating ferredoxin subunit
VTTSWYPIALARDIAADTLVRARFMGAALVLWRGNDDIIRVWEDRCPHRSIRLSAGRNLGQCVECIYHGWRFGPDASVIAIPAEEDRARPDVRVATYPCAVTGGLVWVRARGEDRASPPPPFAGAADILIRPLPIRVPAQRAQPALAACAGMQLRVTPTGDDSCMAFGYGTPLAGETAITTLRRCNVTLTETRRALENGASR